ncbi:hypothetical protein WJ0W_005711 [Paenibacillus melissococcoides]|uniref:Uncharacterized protein n=1 Tax=Paenibacillus melissococcoides TaxID=2912268 RepID=A0ABM9G957_9BACL|nr:MULTISPECIES: hypothetical protein [Paenibacillus]QVQ56219.1 hypothetical protein [Paenibacillus phage Pd_22F]CAH8248529.1 hypothetical protein WJ0W_005711 [Paenibacillus melissococcoides]CAH8714470.1 hypothetical protein WDD9_003900 [Paenibacillus melissococcoides]CAH8719743.1 hypothetical protein HTL2_005708 [Paenibacillus melissococcoides]GIO83050.1 hypothetical protein J6TS7_66600 [Paenibacillus dendritiformis]
MTKKLIAKTPIGYAGHLLSPGDSIREHIHDQTFIALLLEKGHAMEVEVETAAPAPAEAQEQPEEEAPPADKQPEEAPTAETPERKPEAPPTGRKRGK